MGLRRHGLLVMMLGSAGWLTACGGLSSDFEGVYEVDEWTQNLTGCDTPGDSILELQADVMLFVEVQSFFGTDYVGVSHCTDIAECQAAAAEEDFPDIFSGYIFPNGNDDDGWSGELSTTSADSGMCTGSVAYVSLTGTAGALTIESESFDIAPYPPMPSGNDEEGPCDYRDPFEQAEGQPCRTLERLHATFSADL